MPKTTSYETVTFSVPPELRPKFRIVSEDRGMAPPLIVRWLITEFINREFDKIQLRERRADRDRRQQIELERRSKPKPVITDAQLAALARGNAPEQRAGIDDDVRF